MKDGLEALEEAKDIIFEYSGAYMNENVPESEIYGIRKEHYKEYIEKDNMLYSQLDIIEKDLIAYHDLQEQYEILTKELSDLHENVLRTNFETAKKLQALEIIKETWGLTFDDDELTVGIDDVYFLTFKSKEKYNLLKEAITNAK